MDRCNALVGLLLLAALLAFAKPSHAGYAQLSPPTGFGGSSAGWTFNANSANASVFNNRAIANVTANVSGRAVTMPASMRFAANAGQFAVSALRLSPAAVIASAALTAFMLSYDLFYDEATGKWMTFGPDQTVTAYTTTGSGISVAGLNNISGWQAKFCQQNPAACSQTGWTWHTDSQTQMSWGTRWSIRATYTTNNGTQTNTYGTFQVDSFEDGTTTVPGDPEEAQEDDFIVPPGVPLPDNMPGDFPGALPIELPVINPSMAPVPLSQPLRVPMGEPLPVPGTNPQEYRQPVVDIVPSPTQHEPWRVDMQPKDIVGTDPDGIEEPEVVTGEDPVGTPSEEAKTDCDKYPEASGCKPLDVPSDNTVLPEVTIPVAITPDGGWGADNAACPADRSVTMLGQNIPVPFTLFCQYFSGLRYVIIAFAWLGAGFILLGARSD